MFQIKNFISIVAGMVNHMRASTEKITDYNIGSVARTLVEAPAVEIDELYIQMVNGLIESIPVAIYQAFSFERLPATYAAGMVTVTLSAPAVAPVEIASGTVFSVPGTGQSYSSTEPGMIGIGESSATIPVVAVVAGVDGNVLAYTITSMTPPILDATVANTEPIMSGQDEESDVDRKARFIDYIGSLSRGTLWAVEYGLKTAKIVDAAGVVVEQVSRVQLYENIPGRVLAYVYGSLGGVSQGLVGVAQAIVDGSYNEATGVRTPGYRAGGVRVQVVGAFEVPVPLTITAMVIPGYQLDAAMVTALSAAFANFLASIPIGRPLYLSALTSALMTVAGVLSIEFVAPSGNVVVGMGEVLVPGAISIEAAA